MVPNEYFSGNKSLGMLGNIQFGWEIFILTPVAHITFDFKNVVSDLISLISRWFRSGRKRMYQLREKRGYQESPEA